MRELKFRAWDEHYKRVLYTNTDQTVWVGGLESKVVNDTEMWETNVDNKYVMQYTGLKDENGKEIYEGDIVKASYETHTLIEGEWYPSGEFEEDEGVVEYRGTFFGIKNGSILSGYEYVEIIGNIYENPEVKK